RFYQVSGRDPYMRKSAIILAALLTARPTLAAEQCLEVKPNLNIDPAMQPTYAKYADTAHCFLRIDGKVIINRTCHIGVSGDTREWASAARLAAIPAGGSPANRGVQTLL